MEYKLLKYTDKYHDEYIKSQIDAFEKYVIEFFGKFNVATMEKHLEILKEHLKRIVVDKKTAGFVYYNEESDKITVDVFTILPEFRNNKLGSLIMSDFTAKAEKLKKPIFLDTFKTNPAQRFYIRHGFKIVSENKSHFILKYTPTTLVLEEKLNKTKKLKKDIMLTLVSPKIDDAQEMADYRNIMVCQTKYVSADVVESKATKESQEKWIAGTLRDEQSLIVLAKIDGKIVGLGNVTPKRSDRVRYRHVCYIGVSVLKEFWGLGIASAIMEELIEFARKSKFEQIELDVVSTNESAVHLYKKFGFVEEGRLTHAMKYTDGTYANFIIMQKFLV